MAKPMHPRKTTEQFIKDAVKVHDLNYDYDSVTYVNAHTKITIKCNRCGLSFAQKPNNHLSGKGCGACAKESLKMTTSEFVKKAIAVHGTKYDYSESAYSGTNDPIEIKCPEHGSWRTTPACHLTQRTGCAKCGKKRLGDRLSAAARATFAERASVIHGGAYTYENANYRRTNIRVDIFCKKCNAHFSQKPYHHLAGKGCPNCQMSKGEIAIAKFLNDMAISFTHEWKPSGGVYGRKGISYDFLVEGKVLIEYDGKQHWWPVSWLGGAKEFSKVVERDLAKTKWAHENGYTLLRINYPHIKSIKNILEDLLLKTVSDGAGI